MNDYLTTRELADLLRLKERKIYDLAASGKIPCSRATGKLLFPRASVDSWIAEHITGGVSTPAIKRPDVMLGSHDPLLEWAIRESRCGLASNFDSSLDGIERFKQHLGIACSLHVYHEETQSWNRPLIEEAFSNQNVVLVRWARRQRGIIVNQKSTISALGDLRGSKMVPRQKEAGSQVLLNTLLSKQKLESTKIQWQAPARSESDAVLAVLEGKAEATFGLACLAAQYQLKFIPVIEEQFDLLIDRRAWFEPAWQKLLEFCRTDAFIQRAGELAGYDVSGIFSVSFNSGLPG